MWGNKSVNMVLLTSESLLAHDISETHRNNAEQSQRHLPEDSQ